METNSWFRKRVDNIMTECEKVDIYKATLK